MYQYIHSTSGEIGTRNIHVDLTTVLASLTPSIPDRRAPLGQQRREALAAPFHRALRTWRDASEWMAMSFNCGLRLQQLRTRR